MELSGYSGEKAVSKKKFKIANLWIEKLWKMVEVDEKMKNKIKVFVTRMLSISWSVYSLEGNFSKL